MKMKRFLRIRRFTVRALSLIMLAAVLASSLSAFAQSKEKVVRIGWYNSPFNIMDDLGRRSGYAYEYAQKVAIYTNWKFEYVEGSWPELMKMLEEGKIDLMTDVSYTAEREKKMLFSSFPMGSEEYYLYTTLDNKSISSEDYSTLNGKKVGANKGSVQIELFKKWEKANNVNAEIVELSGEEKENMAKLLKGDIDVYLSLDAVSNTASTMPVCKVGSSDFYFAVNQSRTDLLAELNNAMERILEDNRFYNMQLYSKYLKPVGFNSQFSVSEKNWLRKHGRIRIGYQDNYLAFCAKDPKTGELIGALKDYLDVASECMDNAKVEFEPIAFPTAEAALEALKKDEIDCMFPVNLTDYYGETKGYSITSALMNTEMSVIVSANNQEGFFNKERITVAVNAGNPNYEMFLLDHFPEWRSVYFKDTKECLKAISQGKVDCLLMSSFRYNDIANLCNKYNLVSLPAGVKMDYCLGVNRKNTTLYSILNRIICVVPETTMSVALSSYALNDAKSGFFEYIHQNQTVIIAILLPIVLLVLIFVVFYLVSLRVSKQRKELIAATETNSLTGLYMKNYFYEYANRMYSSDPDKPMDAIVLNVINFHSVNAISGRKFGDRILRALGEEILAFVDENGGIAGNSEADQFGIYCAHINDYHILFDRLQKKLDSCTPSNNIRLRMGVMPWQKNLKPNQLFEQARIACNLARGNFKERLIVFDENMRQKEAFEQQLLHDLQRAVDKGEFEVYYQPKFDIQKDPIRLSGSEALVRWRHPQYGLIAPNDFVPLLERNGQIGLVDNFVWREVVKQASLWREKHSFFFPISMNFSRIDIFDDRLEKTLDELIAKYGVDYSAIRLEVTESAYTENDEEMISVIKRLRDKGFSVEMDDFGTGYSSLSMLSAMPIDAIKLDKSFIDDIDINSRQVQLIELILDIAEDLKIPVIAEGVETETQLKLLQDLGCAYAQGFYFSKPLTAEQFEKSIIIDKKKF